MQVKIPDGVDLWLGLCKEWSTPNLAGGRLTFLKLDLAPAEFNGCVWNFLIESHG